MFAVFYRFKATASRRSTDAPLYQVRVLRNDVDTQGVHQMGPIDLRKPASLVATFMTITEAVNAIANHAAKWERSRWAMDTRHPMDEYVASWHIAPLAVTKYGNLASPNCDVLDAFRSLERGEEVRQLAGITYDPRGALVWKT